MVWAHRVFCRLGAPAAGGNAPSVDRVGADAVIVLLSPDHRCHSSVFIVHANAGGGACIPFAVDDPARKWYHETNLKIQWKRVRRIMTETVRALRALEKELFTLQYAINTITFDDSTVAPSESYPGRGEALAGLSAMQHELLSGSRLHSLLEAARSQTLTPQEAAETAELQRMHDEICKVPAEEYAAFSKLTNDAMNVWARARADNDFAAFAPYLEQVFDARRRMASCTDPEKDPYDVLLGQYERGLTTRQCDAFFASLRDVIQPLVRAIREKGAPADSRFLQQHWPLDRQRELSVVLMERIGLDRAHCVLGESAHPCTTELYKGDVRITTHYSPQDLTSNLFSVIHEGGHALYELHTADRLQYTCLAGGSSMSIHESQSRLYENYLGRSFPFLKGILPTLRRLFPGQLDGVSPQQFYRAVNRCEPGLIRIEADELTYCLHIMVRYELEKRLLNGSLQVRELPAAWNALMNDLLGVDVPDDARGVLQDIHWAGGLIGYFPSYALGSAYGAQIMASMRGDLPVDALLEAGDLAPINQWLEQRIWQYGKELAPAQLLQSACGADFDPSFYVKYLTDKYSEIYDL